jgi:hypothetical protein
VKRPRVRFTLRRMVVGIAILGLAFGVTSWLQRMRGRAISYQSMADRHAKLMVRGSHNSTARMRHHLTLRDKYEEAARYPWLPVAPDPPEPE